MSNLGCDGRYGFSGVISSAPSPGMAEWFTLVPLACAFCSAWNVFLRQIRRSAKRSEQEAPLRNFDGASESSACSRLCCQRCDLMHEPGRAKV